MGFTKIVFNVNTNMPISIKVGRQLILIDVYVDAPGIVGNKKTIPLDFCDVGRLVKLLDRLVNNPTIVNTNQYNVYNKLVVYKRNGATWIVVNRLFNDVVLKLDCIGENFRQLYDTLKTLNQRINYLHNPLELTHKVSRALNGHYSELHNWTVINDLLDCHNITAKYDVLMLDGRMLHDVDYVALVEMIPYQHEIVGFVRISNQQQFQVNPFVIDVNRLNEL